MRAPLLSRSHRRRRRGVDYPIEIEFDGDEVNFFDSGWSEAGGNVLNDQIVLGSELIVNGDFSTWTGDDPNDGAGNGWTVSGEVGADPEISEVGTGQGHGGAGTGFCNFFSSATGGQPRISQMILVAGEWIKSVLDIDTVTDAGIGIINVFPTVTYTTTGIKTLLARNTAVNFIIRGITPFTDVTIDDVSIKQFTFISLLNNLKTKFGIADGFFIDVSINAVTAGAQIGIIWNLDSPTSPANFGMAYMDGTNLVVDKNVGGTYSNLASVAQAVTQDQILRIENPAGSNVLDILYNGVSKATPTIADAGIILNTGIALFSTEANNAISKVVIGKL